MDKIKDVYKRQELTPQQEDLKRFVHEMARFLEAFHDV